MSDLASFLIARIAEDEEVARDALDVAHDWLVEDNSIGLWPDDREPPDGYMSFPRRAHARHAACWSPARVLAECEAKRRIVERWQQTAPSDGPYGRGWADARTQEINETLADEVLPLLALPYADHPQYRVEWRP